jgi:hypothetical protein
MNAATDYVTSRIEFTTEKLVRELKDAEQSIKTAIRWLADGSVPRSQVSALMGNANNCVELATTLRELQDVKQVLEATEKAK